VGIAVLLLYVFQLTTGRGIHNILIAQGDNQIAKGNYTQALQSYTYAIWLAPTHASSYLKRANVYRHLGHHNGAVAVLPGAVQA
jgi:Flp pilus assembly protein TadD